MILLQVLGALVVAAAAFQISLLVLSASRRAASEKEQRRLTLSLLEERVLATRKTRQIEEVLQALSWSGFRKFVVAKKVLEDARDGARPPWKWDPSVVLERGDFDARAILEGLYRGHRDIALASDDLDAWTRTFTRDFVGPAPDLGAEGSPKLVREDLAVVYPIEGDAVVVGRAEDAGIVIENKTVSRHHAKVFRQGQNWFIQDLGSQHGTLVNMIEIDRPIRLHSNDHIRLGAADFRLELPGTEPENPASMVYSLYLVPHDGKPLPPFLPGQYLTFQLRIPGIEKPTVRCYSLSDWAHPDYYRVTIKRLPPPRNNLTLPAGLASSFVHEQVREGDILDIQAPRGGFALDLLKENPVVLIGGGIGLTPVLSMLNAIEASGGKRETWLFYGVRNRAEHVMKDHLERVARDNDNIRIQVCYNEPGPNDVQGRDYHHGEHVTVDLMKRLLPSNNYEFFVCGPPPMMDQITKELQAWGVPEAHIHYEAFGPASVKKVARPTTEVAPPGHPFKVTFARSGKAYAWDATASSLLEFASAQGVRIDSGCRAGNCGTCITAVRSGQFSYTIEPGAPAGPGTCLTCISVPTADLVLDA